MSVRTFETGATRDTDDTKPDYEGYLSPLVIERYGEYMLKHQIQSDGTKRPGDNWQKGIPKEAYMKSGWRHFFDWWMEHRGLPSREGLEDALCALMFNTMGYLHEHLKMREFECIDCHENTHEIGEYYMVTDSVWTKAGMTDGMLCIGCLEDRIGRRLTKKDFPDYPINTEEMDWNTRSKRLKNRLGFV